MHSAPREDYDGRNGEEDGRNGKKLPGKRKKPLFDVQKAD